jgi:hypothetical protein
VGEVAMTGLGVGIVSNIKTYLQMRTRACLSFFLNVILKLSHQSSGRKNAKLTLDH